MGITKREEAVLSLFGIEIFYTVLLLGMLSLSPNVWWEIGHA